MFEPSPHDPFKQPDWRWERARWLREKGKYARKDKEDAYVLVAKAFQSDESRVKDELDRRALAAKYPGVYYAWEMKRRADCLEKWSVEAYLLGRGSPEQIANYCHITPETVTWYEKLFFNVLPRLKHSTYIVNAVMKHSVHHGLTERDHDLLWKMIGYAYGHLALADWIQPAQPNFVHSADQIQAAYESAIDAKARKKTFVAIHTIPVYNNQQIIFETYHRAKEIARMGGGADAESLIVNNVHAALCALPFLVGRQGLVDMPRLAHYDEASAELRASEQVQLSAGQETDKHRKLLAWKYPAPADSQAQTSVQPGGQ